jgi:hypothetical protein
VASGLVIAPTRIAQPRPKFPAASAIQATPAAACGRRKRHAGPGRCAERRSTTLPAVESDAGPTPLRAPVAISPAAAAPLPAAAAQVRDGHQDEAGAAGREGAAPARLGGGGRAGGA